MFVRLNQTCLRLAAGLCRQRSATTLLRQPYGCVRSFERYPVRNGLGLSLRYGSSLGDRKKQRNNFLIYTASASIVFGGLSFLAVPLYRIFCQKTGYGGVTQRALNTDRIAAMNPVENRPLTVTFEASKDATMKWNFHPLQSEIQIVPGETALAFYRAKNPTDKPIIGLSTYNVLPYEAGLYFNKIQCFCFEEQRLNPGEEVDMPVFFYIDPEIMEHPGLAYDHDITLSYTFFEAKEEDVDTFLEILQRERGQELEVARAELERQRAQKRTMAEKVKAKEERDRVRFLERAFPPKMGATAPKTKKKSQPEDEVVAKS